MGLSESKEPFEAEGRPQTREMRKEIGICPMWDPRSPSIDFERTPPVFDRTKNVGEYVDSVAVDPRSPSAEITRTPVDAECEKSARDNGILYSELRAQLERLHLYDGDGEVPNTTPNTDILGNDSEVYYILILKPNLHFTSVLVLLTTFTLLISQIQRIKVVNISK